MKTFPAPIRKPAAGVALVLVLAFFLWLARSPVLRSAADLWIVSDAPTQADAAVVLGGGLEGRPYAAAEYFRQGLAPQILVSDVRPTRTERLGVTVPHGELNRRVLLKLGVPENRIQTFGTANRNTHDEALALRAWADAAKVHTVIVPIEIFSARRVRWMLRKAFEGSPVRVEVHAIEPQEYSRSDWWRHEPGLIAFQNEVLKYLYYRYKY